MFKRARNVVIKGGTFTASAGDTYQTINNINTYSATQVFSGSTLATDIPRREDRRTPPLASDALLASTQQKWAQVDRGQAEDTGSSGQSPDVEAPVSVLASDLTELSQPPLESSLHFAPASTSGDSSEATGAVNQHTLSPNTQPPRPQEPFRQRLLEMLGTAYEGAERYRLEQDRIKAHHWKKWGPYLSDRQWVRLRLS